MTRYYGQIVGVELYKSDVVVKRQGLSNNPPAGIRGKVTEFTKASRGRLAFVASNTSVTFRTMITLTYPKEYPTDGEHVKRHLRRFLTWLQRETGGCAYLWWLEFQKRGAPHLHILTDWPLPRKHEPKRSRRHQIATRWYKIADTGDPLHLGAGTSTETLRSPEGGARYAVKYAQKMAQKIVPPEYQNCGRFWGHTRDVKPIPKQTLRCTEDDVRGALEGWKYEMPETCPVWRVLYNQAEWFEKYVKGTIDKHPDAVYTGVEHQLVTAPTKAHSKE